MLRLRTFSHRVVPGKPLLWLAWQAGTCVISHWFPYTLITALAWALAWCHSWPLPLEQHPVQPPQPTTRHLQRQQVLYCILWGVVCLYVLQTVCMYLCLSYSLFVCLSVCLPLCLSDCLSFKLFACVFVACLPISFRLPVCHSDGSLPIFQTVYLYMSFSLSSCLHFILSAFQTVCLSCPLFFKYW